MPHESKRDTGYRGHDPLIKSWREGASFNKLWLKSDRKMKPVQAIGFTSLNLLFIGFGLFFAQGLRDTFRESTFSGCFFATGSAVCLYLGFRGLISVYKSL